MARKRRLVESVVTSPGNTSTITTTPPPLPPTPPPPFQYPPPLFLTTSTLPPPCPPPPHPLHPPTPTPAPPLPLLDKEPSLYDPYCRIEEILSGCIDCCTQPDRNPDRKCSSPLQTSCGRTGQEEVKYVSPWLGIRAWTTSRFGPFFSLFFLLFSLSLFLFLSPCWGSCNRHGTSAPVLTFISPPAVVSTPGSRRRPPRGTGSQRDWTGLKKLGCSVDGEIDVCVCVCVRARARSVSRSVFVFLSHGSAAGTRGWTKCSRPP